MKNYTTTRRTEKPSETTTACVSLLFFLESGVVLSRTVLTTPIVTYLSFSERIAIANLSYYK